MSSKQHVFVGNVLHSKVAFKKGQLCPAELHSEMLKKGLISPLPEPLKEEPKAPEEKAKAKK